MTGDPHTPPPGHAARVVLGVGASRGCPPGELSDLVDATLAEAGLARSAVVAVASADVKADEAAILDLAAALGVPTRFLPAPELAAVDVPTPSAVVAGLVGTPSVAEAAALLVAGSGGPVARLLVPKRRSAHATCAVASPAHAHATCATVASPTPAPPRPGAVIEVPLP